MDEFDLALTWWELEDGGGTSARLSQRRADAHRAPWQRTSNPTMKSLFSGVAYSGVSFSRALRLKLQQHLAAGQVHCAARPPRSQQGSPPFGPVRRSRAPIHELHCLRLTASTAYLPLRCARRPMN